MTRAQFTAPANAYTGPTEQAEGPILVAAKGDGHWSPAVEAASLLAERDRCPVQVIGVVEPLPLYAIAPGVEPPPMLFEDEWKTALLSALQEQIRRTPHDRSSWSAEVAYGPPAQTLARLARERHARLLIMGIGRHTPADRLFGGETTLHTLRAARCPVLAVPAEFARLPRRAVVGIDFSPASVWAAEQAMRLLDDGGVLTLVHVKSRLELSQPVWAAWDARYERRVGELFGRLRAMLPPPDGVQVELVDRVGDPADEILAYASATGADLIAVGSHGAGFFERLVVGSVATAVLRCSTCAVLACPRPSAADDDRIQRALTGTAESIDPNDWASRLEAFTRRNSGRPATLEVDDPALGAQGQQHGFAFIGASYDHHDRRVEIMVGDPSSMTRHLTRNVAHVSSIAVRCDPGGRDRALRVLHGRGQTLLTLGG